MLWQQNINKQKIHKKTHYFNLRGDAQCRRRSLRRIDAGILTDSIGKPGSSKVHLPHAFRSRAGQTGQMSQVRHDTGTEGREQKAGNKEIKP